MTELCLIHKNSSGIDSEYQYSPSYTTLAFSEFLYIITRDKAVDFPVGKSSEDGKFDMPIIG